MKALLKGHGPAHDPLAILSSRETLARCMELIPDDWVAGEPHAGGRERPRQRHHGREERSRHPTDSRTSAGCLSVRESGDLTKAEQYITRLFEVEKTRTLSSC
jgi:hypothetical protein